MTLDEIAARADVIGRCLRANPNDCYDRGDLDEAVIAAREDVPRLVAALKAVEAVVSERYKLWAAICGETCGKEVYGIDHDAIADSIAAAIETAIKDALGS
jgi:hypothetical protein